ncbi:MAG: plasmid mobilization relaxosome protein MobC [Firmicutes bacterium]|nr:plasmid mobilization relaxosome protein MobC [Bacillota bacterium]
MGRFRNERINVRLSDFEKEIFYKQMKRAGHKNVTDFIMTAICKHWSTVVDTSPILEIKGELSRLGNNVNQIAKVANSTQNIYAEDVEQMREELNAVRDLVEKAFQMCVEGRKIDCGVHEDNADTDKFTPAKSV